MTDKAMPCFKTIEVDNVLTYCLTDIYSNTDIAPYKLSFNQKILIIEPAHDKAYEKTIATSKDSDQPAHTRSLIRVFADRMCLLQHPGSPKWDKREPVPYWVDVSADLGLCWSHGPYCRFCHALAYLSYFSTKTYNRYSSKVLL